MKYRNTVTGAEIVTCGTVCGGDWVAVSKVDTPPSAATAEPEKQETAQKPKRRVKKADGELRND